MKREVVAAAAAEIRRRWPASPKAALVLGTGLGKFAEQICADTAIPYRALPGFTRTTAISHRGQLVCGTLHGIPVILLDGRCHLYEGYGIDELTLPIRTLHACGAANLIVTNASGGLNRYYLPGDIMVIDDHINLLGRCPRLTQQRDFPRQPLRTHGTAYDPRLSDLALDASRRHGFAAYRGVYAAVTGPNYETRAEYAMLRRIGADAVGMSTVPEVQVAQQLAMRVLGLSIITNVAHLTAPEAVDAWHVVDAAQQAEPHVRQILDRVIRSL